MVEPALRRGLSTRGAGSPGPSWNRCQHCALSRGSARFSGVARTWTRGQAGKRQGRRVVTIPAFSPGGYRFIPAVFQYSGGVAAEPGFQIERVVFREPLPLALGFERAEAHHHGARAAAHGLLRLRAALAAAVLRRRLPRRSTSSTWRRSPGGASTTARTNPVARSNVCPEMTPPARAVASTRSASRCRRTAARRPSWWPAAARPGRAAPPTASARSATARPVQRRCGRRRCSCWARWSGGSGFWARPGADTTATQVYTVHDLYPFLADEIVRRGAARAGLTWHLCRPPVRGLEYEMDCRGVAAEHFVE